MVARAGSARAVTARVGSAPRRRRPTEQATRPVNWRLLGGLLSISSIVGGSVAELAVLVPSGTIGEPLRRSIVQTVGLTAPLLPAWPIMLGTLGLLRVLRPEPLVSSSRIWGAGAAHLALIGLVHVVLIGGPGSLARAQDGQGGGLIGFGLGVGLSDTLGPTAAAILLVAALLLGLLAASDVTLSRAARWLAINGWRLGQLGLVGAGSGHLGAARAAATDAAGEPPGSPAGTVTGRNLPVGETTRPGPVASRRDGRDRVRRNRLRHRAAARSGRFHR